MSAELESVFVSTREELSQLGVQDEFFLDLVTTRLIVERIAESDNLGCWDSRVFSETGRDRLAEVVPKTSSKARIDLAMQIGRKVESNRVPEDSITLFWFGPQIESRLEASLDEIQEDEDASFEALESLSIHSVDSGWSAPLVAAVSDDDIDADSLRSSVTTQSGDSLSLADSGYSLSGVEDDKRLILESLTREYGGTIDTPLVPFYGLKSDNESKTP